MLTEHTEGHTETPDINALGKLNAKTMLDVVTKFGENENVIVSRDAMNALGDSVTAKLAKVRGTRAGWLR